MNCDGCIHNRFQKGAVRGVMDCDPDENWCEKDMWFFYEDEPELDEDGEEITCPYYKHYEEDDY